MTESMKYYESIRRKYPETVSKDQFYQIAHISKATALHLLQNSLVPCKDTGKKTRRYTIRTDDIIFYLIDRELHPEVYRAPDRWYQERSGHYNSRVTYRNELTRMSEEERASFRKYMEDEFCQYGDLLTVVEVAEAIGYCDTSLHRWCNAKKLKSFNTAAIPFLHSKIKVAHLMPERKPVMDNKIEVFKNEQFGEIRTTLIENEPWFVAVDVCRALEIGNSSQAISRLDADEKMNTLISNEGKKRGNPNMTVVNEPGLYTLILRSRKPEAKAFKRWITHEVIPTIRKTGGYMTDSLLERIQKEPAVIV